MKISEAQELIDFIVISGKRIKEKSGHIQDIGVKKKYLTEEDIAIERGIKEITLKLTPNATFFAEEEHDTFVDDEDVWVCDPISGTKLFIEGLPHYAIVASHLKRGVVDFAVVYDPSVDDLYAADYENGLFLNVKKIETKTIGGRKIIYAPTHWGQYTADTIDKVRITLQDKFEVFPSQGSFAFNYCLVACRLFDGVVSLAKDSYPEFAGCFIANMAGCIATNGKGSKDIMPTDRIFVCGNTLIHKELLQLVNKTIAKDNGNDSP